MNDFSRSDAKSVYNASLDRCVAAGGFLDRFYQRFIGSSDEVKEKFKHTDFDRQKEAVRASLYFMMNQDDWSMQCDSQIEALAERHNRQGLDIRPELYDLWLDCLLQAVRESDPQFDAEVESAWRTILQPSIDYFKSRY